MGIDIEAYRQKIGTFQPNIMKQKTRGEMKKKMSEFLNRASKFRRNELNIFEILMCLGFYLAIINEVSGTLQNKSVSETNLTINENIYTFESQSNSMYLWMTTKQINKICHIMEGNKRNPGYKYFSWNCDRGFLSGKKLDDLKCYVLRNKTHIISVSEINLVRNKLNKN